MKEGNTPDYGLLHQHKRSPPIFFNQQCLRVWPSLTVGLLTHFKAVVVDYSDEIFSGPPGRSISKRAAMRYSVLRLMPRISAAFFRLPPVASNTCSR